jgi:hypothetical protein
MCYARRHRQHFTVTVNLTPVSDNEIRSSAEEEHAPSSPPRGHALSVASFGLLLNVVAPAQDSTDHDASPEDSAIVT